MNLIACFMGLIKLCVKLAWLEMGFEVPSVALYWLRPVCACWRNYYVGGGLPREAASVTYSGSIYILQIERMTGALLS